MPRKPANEECMFCGASPCVCNAKAKPSSGRVSRQASPKPAEAPAIRASRPTLSQIRKPAAPEPARPPYEQAPVQPPTTSKVRSIRSQEDAELRQAVTTLADAELLSAESLIEHRNLIDLPSWRVDALIWRQS